MTGAVALEIDRHRQAGDVGWHGGGVHRQRCGPSTESQRADAKVVEACQEILFKLGGLRISACLPHRAQK